MTRLTPFPCYQPTSENALLLLERAGRSFVVKVYRGPRAADRHRCERRLLESWEAHGLEVPNLVDLPVPDLAAPYLVMHYVPGRSLRHELAEHAKPIATRLERAAVTLASLRRRGELARNLGDVRLIHPDPNTGNVVFDGCRPVWIDLETQKRAPSVLIAAAEELVKLCIWMGRDLGKRYLPAVAQRVIEVYRGQEDVMEMGIALTCQRRCQWFHNWRAHRRKQRAPDKVTKYDVANVFREALAGRARLSVA